MRTEHEPQSLDPLARRLVGNRASPGRPDGGGSSVSADPLAAFLDLRSTLRAEPIGDGGPDTCAALTDALDAAIRQFGAEMGPDAAVVALGGYGRREQCLWSDVDVMLLHRRADTESLARAVFYPLWNANLKVGHAVRTVEQCRLAGREELQTLTTLLSARLVVGNGDLYGEFQSALVELVRDHPLSPRLADQERQRRLAEPYPLMAADLKEGRGALRTHEGFWWERRRAELIGAEYDAPTPEERDAKATLLSVRNALHSAAGRAVDRFVFDLREPAAHWLRSEVLALATSLTTALHTGDRLADRRWPDLHVEPDPPIGLGRRIFGAIRTRFSSPPTPDAGDSNDVLAIAVRAAGRPEGAWLESAEEDLIRTSPEAAWTAADRTAFVLLLSAGARGRTIFGLLEELGWVERQFPEWMPVATAPQLAPFHEHPVGAHLWRCVDEMLEILDGDDEIAGIADEVGSTEELLLAAFLHDIGKARGGNHEVVGAELAAAFLRRAGFGPATIAAVSNAVLHHLLLAETATRRDYADPTVIDEVAAIVDELHQLQILYLLTIADLRATGSTMWNEWRATLLRRLYRRVAKALETGETVRATPDIEAIAGAAGGMLERRLIEEHVAAMPADYLDTTSPHEVAWHLEVVSRLDRPGLVSAYPRDPGRVVVAGSDRAGFLLAVSRAFTANGVAVLDARLRTRSDGVALDTFHVVDDRTGEAVAPDRWDRVAGDLIGSLTDQRDLRPVVRERVESYRHDDDRLGEVEVRIDSGGHHTVIEVRAPDRIGLLTDIVEALHDVGLDVSLAKIDTMGAQARDIFHVRRGGGPIRSESDLASIQTLIAERLRV